MPVGIETDPPSEEEIQRAKGGLAARALARFLTALATEPPPMVEVPITALEPPPMPIREPLPRKHGPNNHRPGFKGPGA
jgi:hypothetical protein